MSLMTDSEWGNIHYFSPSENWGNKEDFGDHPWQYMEARLIHYLDHFRRLLGHRVFLSPNPNAGVCWTGHAPASFHYPQKNSEGKIAVGGRAIDIFPDCNIQMAWTVALQMECWAGIGIYPHAKWEDKGLHGMLHLDIGSKYFNQKRLWWQDTHLFGRKKRYRSLWDNKRNCIHQNNYKELISILRLL